jgi:hypothetical protein
MKTYDFIIVANPAETIIGSVIGSDWITIRPLEYIHKGVFNGTVQELQHHVLNVKKQVIAENTFTNGSGFSLSIILRHGQRKPANWDQTRRLLSSNYIHYDEALAA